MVTRIAVLVSILAVSIHAQQVSETVEVRLIEVDAVVTDRAGNPVTGLTAADFELFENGKPQPITNFSEYVEQTLLSAPSSVPMEQQEQTGVSALRPPSRTIVLFIDSLPLRGPERAKLFDNLRSLVERTMRAGDRAEVLLWNDDGGLRAMTPLTTDRKLIDAAIRSAEDNANVRDAGATQQQFFEPTAANTLATKHFAAERELALMRRKTAAMQRIVSALAQPAGRNVFVYVSELFPAVAGKRASTGRRAVAEMESPDDIALRSAYTTRHMLDAVIGTANANGVSFYAVRPERPTTSPIGSIDDDAAVVDNPHAGLESTADQIVLQNEIASLSLVAEQTGGTFGVGARAVEEIVERIVRDVSSYYTLAYRARSDGSDRTRRIEVRAKNPAHRVRTRSTIVEKSDRTRAREALTSRLFEHEPAGEIPFGVTIGEPVTTTKNRLETQIELSIPAERLRFEREGKELAAKFTVMTSHGNADITEQSKRIAVPAGKTPEGAIRYEFKVLHDAKTERIAVGVFDEKSGLSGSRSVALDPWQEALDRARREKKPILAFEKPARCGGACAAFEKQSLEHPAVQRRLDELVLVTRPAKEPALALYDRSGSLVTRIDGLPRDLTAFATLLDSIGSIKPNLERAVVLNETGPHEGDLELAAALIILGRASEARAAVDRATAHGRPATREYAVVVRAMLDVSDGKRDEALAALNALTTSASTPDIAAMAWIGIGSIHRGTGEFENAIRAYARATEVAEPGSATQASAAASLAQLRGVASSSGPISIMPMHEQIVSGRRTVRTFVSSTDVARVVFTIDGEQKAIVERPPFSATLDFGGIPQARTVRAVAHDVSGKEIGRDELTINHAGDMFWIRLIEPREGAAEGSTRVTATLRAPAGRIVKRVTVTWNDGKRAVLTSAPWQAEVEIPRELGVLRASAELDDGRTSEDAVLLNTSGHVERLDVPLVEIPVTITEDGAPARVGAADIAIREQGKPRAIESVTSGTDSVLTVGIVLDTSESMYKRLLDVQEAALRFLENGLGPNDRAFIITFDSRAQLVQTATADRELLRRQILGIRTAGMTALYDAMILGLLQFEGIKGRRAMIVFSDGSDTASRYGTDDVEDLARRSNIPIYLIAARPDMPVAGMSMAPMPQRRPVNDPGFFPPVRTAQPSTLLQRSAALKRLVDFTGGMTHYLNKLGDLPATYEKIAEALRAQSLVVIRTDPGRTESDWRKIDVDVKGRNRDVRAPAGYYAPW